MRKAMWAVGFLVMASAASVVFAQSAEHESPAAVEMNAQPATEAEPDDVPGEDITPHEADAHPATATHGEEHGGGEHGEGHNDPPSFILHHLSDSLEWSSRYLPL